jgi:Flp pilus assembly protein TadG
LLIPVVLVAICVAVEVGNLWLARLDLENAVEASALAAVKSWGSGSTTATSRAAGVDYARANTVVGQTISATDFSANHTAPTVPNPNGNLDPVNGNLVFGSVSGSTFSDSTAPGGANDFAVHAQASYSVNSICNTLFGAAVGPFSINADATAGYAVGAGPPQLIRISNPP